MKALYLLHSHTRIKIGIARRVDTRLRDIDRTTKGKQRLIFAVLLPWGARRVEAWLHCRYARWHAPYRVGSGRSEWYKIGLWCLELPFLMLWAMLWRWGVVLAGGYVLLFILLNFGVWL